MLSINGIFQEGMRKNNGIPFFNGEKINIQNKYRKVKTVEIMTQKQKELIKDNLRAYENNFGYIKIVKEDYGKGFYVFTSEERAESGSWTQYCYNIDYLNGWLYGAVQAVNGIMKPIEKQ